MPSARESTPEVIVTGLPSISISPALGATRPASTLIMVDLPDPLEPSSAMTSPGDALSDAPFSATTASNRFSIPRNSNMNGFLLRNYISLWETVYKKRMRRTIQPRPSLRSKRKFKILCH